MEEKLFNINDFGSMNSDKIKSMGQSKCPKKYYYILGGTIALLLIVIIISIIIIINSSDSSSDNKREDEEKKEIKTIIGSINCTFDINNINTKIPIIGSEFKKESDFGIYIDDKKINHYLKEYSFDKFGIHKIYIELYENINMNYMFKDIENIISIEMNSDKNAKILSMESTFENCMSLTSFNITGFNTEQLISMKKIFYNSYLSDIDLNIKLNNIEDMSYMFAGTNINFEKLLKLNLKTNNLINISYMFYNCASLTKFNFSLIDISKVGDVSYV